MPVPAARIATAISRAVLRRCHPPPRPIAPPWLLTSGDRGLIFPERRRRRERAPRGDAAHWDRSRKRQRSKGAANPAAGCLEIAMDRATLLPFDLRGWLTAPPYRVLGAMCS